MMGTPQTFDVQRMLAFDLETTGRDPHSCRIVTSAMVRLAGRDKDATLLLADPGVDIPAEATAVHGISTEYAQEHGRPHDEVLADTIAGLRAAWADGFAVVAFNAAYDLTVLRTQDPTFTVDGLVFDPYVIDKKFDTYRKGKRTLEATCEHYQVRLEAAHDATEDALAAARVAWMMARKWPELTTMNAEELMENQAVWYFEQASSLKQYLEDQGKDATDVGTSWPMDG
ncbi:3'-5' exonuclease [Corynebacterium sp. H113]|uniref:3'-5' exonuclease n=2 Tax=Corynebacterium sp. H113 TaxID=3133419 RepID=UPI0030B6BA71